MYCILIQDTSTLGLLQEEEELEEEENSDDVDGDR
jgi:hypothetical protein